MWRLDGKTVLLGVSGGIAAYKSAEVTRRLVEAGATVRVVMTRNAAEFVSPLTFQALSGHPVAWDTFDLSQEAQIGHIRLADSADVVLVAPATANVLAKMAHGLADDLLTTVLLATRAPILVAPAMNVNMFENPAVQANLAVLRGHGVRVIDPDAGFLACGYEGKGRLPDPEVLLAEVRRALTPRDFAGLKVLVSAGPNREPLDPVRFLSNRSTGKMGFALAAAAWRRGADVVLVCGPTQLPTPHGVRRVDVETALEMLEAMRREWADSSIVFMCAAVADYRPARTSAQKIRKGEGPLVLELERNPDILQELGREKGARFVVGFAAETEDVLSGAERKLREKKLDLVVANDVGRKDAGFAADTNAVTLLDASGASESLPLLPKDEVAERIVERVVELRAARARAAG
ncbi:MAG: peptidase ClpP [Candidatus Binatia bacterium]|nr:MAG: peptidase ClpP [Candidatus Binatia bacterium]